MYGYSRMYVWMRKGLVEELTKMLCGSAPLAECAAQIRGRNEIHNARLNDMNLLKRDRKIRGLSFNLEFH